MSRHLLPCAGLQSLTTLGARPPEPTTTKVVLYTPRDLVEITGDVDAFNAAYGSVNGNGIPMSFKFIEDNK